MHSIAQNAGVERQVASSPWLAVLVCVIGFAATTTHSALPGAFPVMFRRGEVRLGLAEVGVLSGILYLGLMIAGPVAGRLADSFGRKLPLVCSALLMTSATALMAIARDYPTLLAARLLCGLGAGGIIPLVYAYLVDVLPEKWQGPSSLGMAAAGGGAASFATVFVVRQGMAAGPDGWRLAMWGFAGLAGLTLVGFALFIRPDAGRHFPQSAGAAGAAGNQAGSGAGLWANHRRTLLVLMVTTACVAIMNSAFFVSIVPIMLGRGASEADALAVVGTSVAASMLSLGIGAVVSNRLSRWVMLSGASIIGLASLMLFACSGTMTIATLGSAGTIFGTGLCFGALPFYAAEVVPEHLRGRLTGVVSGLTGLVTLATPLVAGLLYESSGEFAPIVLVGTALALVPAILIPFGPKRSDPVSAANGGE